MIWHVACVLVLILSSGAISLAAEVKSSWKAEWEQTVATAEKEGLVSVYIFDAGPLTEETVQAFERAYPKIKVSQLRGRGNDLGSRSLVGVTDRELSIGAALDRSGGELFQLVNRP